MSSRAGAAPTLQLESDRRIKSAQMLRDPYRLWVNLAAPVALAAYVGWALYLAFLRHAALHTFLFDLGFFTQLLWNTAQGNWLQSSLKPDTFFGGHLSPVLLLLTPFVRLVPNGRTLLLFQQISLAVAVLPGYFVLRRARPGFAPLLVIAFVLNPLLHQVASAEFQGIMFAVPTLALALYALETKKEKLFWLAIGLTLLVREDMGIYVASIGLYVLTLRKRPLWHGILLVLVGAAWVIAIPTYVFPYLAGSPYPYTNLFEEFGGSFGEIAVNLARNPLLLISRWFEPAKMVALWQMLYPMAFLPLLAPGEQLLWVPGVLALLTTSEPEINTLGGWWVAPLLPLLWFAAARALSRLQDTPLRLAAAVMVVAALAGFVLTSRFPGGGRFAPEMYALNRHAQIGQEILGTIPPDASLATTNRLGAHAATRREIYLYPWIPTTASPQYFLLDAQEPDPYPLSSDELEKAITRLMVAPRVETVREQDGYFLFRAHDSPAFEPQGPWIWEPYLRLNGYHVTAEDDAGAFLQPNGTLRAGKQARVVLYWTALETMDRGYRISVQLVDGDGQVVAEHEGEPALGSVPTTKWLRERNVRDVHYLDIPADAPLELSLRVSIRETDSDAPLAPSQGFVLTALPVQP
ncbi:MAG: DUF2079 domain-containing protein [Anaerolineae bacterium]|nr:DUF2079 domain-containing protein [Anaerolineae bacterium]